MLRQEIHILKSMTFGRGTELKKKENGQVIEKYKKTSDRHIFCYWERCTGLMVSTLLMYLFIWVINLQQCEKMTPSIFTAFITGKGT